MYASSWFLTLYTTALNLNLICCRIMDVFLSEGMEMIFKIALALLTIGKETVLSLDMEAMLKVSQICYQTSSLITITSCSFSISRKNCRGKLKATLKVFSISHIPSKSTRRR
jgi:Rab-GTPase-TBC domain